MGVTSALDRFRRHPDAARLQLLEAHPFYRRVETGRDAVYEHRLTGRQVRYNPRRQEFNAHGYGGKLAARLSGGTARHTAVERDLERYVFAADDTVQHRLEHRLDRGDHDTGRLTADEYGQATGRQWWVVLDDEYLEDDEIAVESAEIPVFLPVAEDLGGLDCIRVGWHRRDGSDAVITVDPAEDPYQELVDREEPSRAPHQPDIR